MDNKAPYLRMAGLLVIAYIFIYTSDKDFNDQYSQNFYEAEAELKSYQAMGAHP